MVRDSKTAKTVRSSGHSSSGGHVIRQNSAISRANRFRWDNSDGLTGDSMPYQYQEYPKHVYPNPDNTKHFIIVRSPEEERLALGGEEIINEEDERTRLLTVASIKGVQVDKRWGPAKLTKAIETAGFDPALNPFE